MASASLALCTTNSGGSVRRAGTCRNSPSCHSALLIWASAVPLDILPASWLRVGRES